MQFVDEAVIEVQAGKGGNGCLSFHRARNLPRGGPDGGNGGNGGSVRLVGDVALNTLADFRFTPRCRAENGRHGGSSDKTGADGRDLDVRVPVGTTVVDEETRSIIGDVAVAGETLIVARGGARGFGNARFKSSTNRAPRRTTAGRLGERRRLRLELKVIADVGLLGLPNAGKSTLISRVSASKPKIADYPFTTLIPNLGVVRVDQDASFVMADVPGLVPGASKGAGLGMRFLKHLSRARLLLHLVHAAPIGSCDATALPPSSIGRDAQRPVESDPVNNARAIEAELFAYSAAFRERTIWMVVTKMDLPGGEATLKQLRQAFPHRPCRGVSAITGQGIDQLNAAVMAHVAEYRERLRTDAAFAERERDFDRRVRSDVVEREFAAAAERRNAKDATDDEVEVAYRRD